MKRMDSFVIDLTDSLDEEKAGIALAQSLDSEQASSDDESDDGLNFRESPPELLSIPTFFQVIRNIADRIVR